jgi:hypothetical protein
MHQNTTRQDILAGDAISATNTLNVRYKIGWIKQHHPTSTYGLAITILRERYGLLAKIQVVIMP